MPTKKYISFFIASLTIALVCLIVNSAKSTDLSDENPAIPPTEIYGNEYGEIHLTPLNDTIMHTVFFNNEGKVFDTIMKVNYHFSLLPDDSLPFLHWKTGGIKVWENRLEIHDFAGPAYMAMAINIENIYDRPFYKLNDTIVLKDEVKHPKGGERMHGIYVIPGCGYQNEYVHLTGIVTKEKYPREYYSTADGPQGMFSDTTEIHYRLVVKPISTKVIEKYVYTGTTMNIDGRAAFIWDFADSEAYYLDNHAPWTKEELNKSIKIEGVLVQYIDQKSMLKCWKIIE